MEKKKRKRKPVSLLTLRQILIDALDEAPSLASHPRPALCHILVDYDKIVSEFGQIAQTTDWLTKTTAARRVILGVVHARFPKATLEQVVADVLNKADVSPQEMEALRLAENTKYAVLPSPAKTRL